MRPIQIKKLRPDAKLPVYSLPGDAGMDLFSAEDVVIAPGARHSVSTGIAIRIPAGYVGLIWDKGGLSHKKGLKTLGGVFDSNYLGEYLIGLVNLGTEDFVVKKGEKVAQVLFQQVEAAVIEEVTEFGEDTARGERRFGSTGTI
jgi:dUTP pyrophosphatase